MKPRNFKRSLPLVLVAFALILMSFVLIRSNASRNHVNLESYSGEQLFRGIYFMQGEIAQYIPSRQEAILKFNMYPDAVKKQHLAFSDEVVAFIKQNMPEFFDTFKEKIVSRDYASTAEALQEAGKAIFEAGLSSPLYNPVFSTVKEMAESGEIKKYDFSNEDSKNAFTEYLVKRINEGQTAGTAVPDKGMGGSEKAVIPIFVVGAAVAVNIAAVAEAGAVWFYALFWPFNYGPEVQSKLGTEKMVAEIANI